MNTEIEQRQQKVLAANLRHGIYKTAYSELYETFVQIIRVHDDGTGELVITASVPGKDENHLFRPFELSEYRTRK